MTGAARRHYLDHACTSPPSDGVVAAVRAAAEAYAVPPSDGGGTALALRWLELRDDARGAVARLLGVQPETVTLVENTTQGLGVLADGLDLSPGDNVAIPDCEFLGLTAVWRRREAAGVELRPIPSRQGAVHVDDVARTIDARTRLVALSAVQEVSGVPVDLDAVVDAADSVGALVAVDGIQEAGVIARNLADSGVAAYSAGGHKWLRNPYSLGFLWTSAALRDRLRPSYQGYFALTEPAQGWGTYLADADRDAFDRADLRTDASALETGGTPNWLGAVGLATSIAETLHTGIADIETRARTLADTLRAGLQNLGVATIYTEPGTRSTIVTFQPLADTESTAHLATALAAAGIDVSVRGVAGVAGIRAACHAHNTQADIDALLEVVRASRQTCHRRASVNSDARVDRVPLGEPDGQEG